MTKKLVAISRSDYNLLNSNKKSQIDIEIIKLTEKEKPNILFLLYSQQNNIEEKHYNIRKDIYEKMYDCNCNQLKREELANKEYVNSLIKWADIIYVSGENTFEMINNWKKTDFDKTIQKAWEEGKVICGDGEGAKCWFRNYYNDSLQIENKNISTNGLSFYDGLFVPQCEKIDYYDSLKEQLKEKDNIGFLFSMNTALIIIENQYKIIKDNQKEESFAMKTYWQDGDYKEEKLNIFNEFDSLDNLYKKTYKSNKDPLTDLAIVVYSCDKNEEVWYPFYKCLEKYWKNHPKTYLLTETLVFDKIETINYNYELDHWTTRIRNSLKDIKEKYILFICDDCFLDKEVNVLKLKKSLELIEEGYSCVQFEISNDPNDIDSKYEGFKEKTKYSTYIISLLCGVWNKEKLIDILKNDSDPWNVEITRDYRFHKFLQIKDEKVISWFNDQIGGNGAIKYGKWNKSVVNFLEKENIKVDFSKKGFRD